jgi:trans-aconitate methyltransferase
MTNSHDASHWAVYNAAQKRRGIRPLCQEVLKLAGAGKGRTALDLGCGLGKETGTLLTSGWRVHAIDSEPGTRKKVLATTHAAHHDRLTIHAVPFADLTTLPPVDLAYAGYSLPYLAPDEFTRFWDLLRSTLLPGGWLAVNLFGVRDSWAGSPTGTFLTEDAARGLFDGMEIVAFQEEDKDGDAYSGPKHWHVFDVIARRAA